MKPLAAVSRLIVQYFQGAYYEFRRVTWPSRSSVVNYTVVVIVTVIVSVLVLTAFDYGLQQLANRYLIR